MKNVKKAPLPMVRRLAIYHHVLLEIKQRQIMTTSSTKLAEILEYKPIQVRKDLQLVGLTGKPKTGYRVDELEDAISRALGWSVGYQAVLFGAGNLGSALLNYPWIEEYGLRFIAAFDSAADRSNILVNNIPVYSTKYFPTYASQYKIDIGVIAVPAEHAQSVGDMIVEAGIEGIWNFSYTHVKTPPRVTIENALFTQSLAILTRRLIEKRSTESESKE